MWCESDERAVDVAARAGSAGSSRRSPRTRSAGSACSRCRRACSATPWMTRRRSTGRRRTWRCVSGMTSAIEWRAPAGEDPRGAVRHVVELGDRRLDRGDDLRGDLRRSVDDPRHRRPRHPGARGDHLEGRRCAVRHPAVVLIEALLDLWSTRRTLGRRAPAMLRRDQSGERSARCPSTVRSWVS